METKKNRYIVVVKTDTMTLSKDELKNTFWLWDKTRGMNLAMDVKTETDAFIQALDYYQKRLVKVEAELKDIRGKVENFVEQFSNTDDEN